MFSLCLLDETSKCNGPPLWDPNQFSERGANHLMHGRARLGRVWAIPRRKWDVFVNVC